MTAWLTIVTVTLTVWLLTGVAASVSMTVIVALSVPAPACPIEGETLITTLFAGASVPLDCETGVYVLAVGSSRMRQFKGALPVFVMVKLWVGGFCPMMAWKLKPACEIAIFATGGGLTFNVTITGVAVTPP